MECKNYSTDIANPEIDQLLGRLNRRRGFVGLLFCREVQDPELVLKRCRDIVSNSDKHLILVMDDGDLLKLLGHKLKGELQLIDEFLEDKLKAILL